MKQILKLVTPISTINKTDQAGKNKIWTQLNSTAHQSPGYNYHLWTTSGEGNGTPLQSSCLENSMDGGAWQAAVHGVAKSQT